MKNEKDMDALLNQVFGSPKTRPTDFGRHIAESESLLDAVNRTSRAMQSTLARTVKETAPTGKTEPKADAVKTEKAMDALCRETGEDVAALQKRLAQDGVCPAAIGRAVYEKDPGVFSRMEEQAKKSVFGQDAFLHALFLAMKRPFATGCDEGRAQNAVLLSGSEGTGRHTAVRCVLSLMKEETLLPSEEMASVDLARYPSAADEKLFLQDLYMALSQKTPIVCFDHLENCLPAFAAVLADLVKSGRHRLSSRYAMQNGRLIDAGGALLTNAVSEISAEGKYLLFFTTLKKAKVADRFGAAFYQALGDVCETSPLPEEALSSIAEEKLRLLAEKCAKRLSLSLTWDESVKAVLLENAKHDARRLAQGADTLFAALSQWKLETDAPKNTAASLSAAPDWVLTTGEKTAALSPYLPQTYSGALDEVKKELESIVGLRQVKDYIFSLEDHLQVQQRRRDSGMKDANVSMHMIFTGNPGTGKTTIARIISRYLKAIGVLTGGQLIEVTRADLVGRYVGHTAPLTMSVLRSALGGVLFIDEAYSLYRGENDSFGLEAIDALVKGMEDHRENLVVILAGYTREMEEFLSSNSGLRSRFPNIIEFPDYTGEELLAITRINAAQRGYRLGDGVEDALLDFYNRAQAQNAKENGNGRLARNKLEQAIVNQSRRLVAEPDAALDELQTGDFDLDDIR